MPYCPAFAQTRRTKVFDVNVISGGDPLEIYTDRDGEVIFKKYSPMGEMGAVSAELAEALARTAGMSCAICDRDAVIAAAGGVKKGYSGAEYLIRAGAADGTPRMLRTRCGRAAGGAYLLAGRAARWLRRRRSLQTAMSAAVSRCQRRTKRRMRCCSSCVSPAAQFLSNAFAV